VTLEQDDVEENTHTMASETLDCEQKSRCSVIIGMQPCRVQLKLNIETTKRTETLNDWTSHTLPPAL